MAKRFLFFILVGSLGINAGYAQNSTPQKHALIIAVGKYDQQTTGWWNLSSKNDAVLLHNTLQQIGFESNNIDTLIDEKATKTGVLNALIALAEKANAGDMIIVHYSGHGQQLPDDNGDEEDKMDECLVLYGAKNPNVKKIPYDISGYLRDEEFGEALAKIRTKLGPAGHLLVIMDSCHSGSATRAVDDELNRGDRPYQGNTSQTSDIEEVGFGIVTGNTNDEFLPNISKFVFISAANAHQLAKQTHDENKKPVGALTYAFSKAILNRSSDETYQSLFASIQSELKGRGLKQTPTLEGDSEYTIFGGDYIRQKPFFKIKEIENDSIITLKGGNLVGLYPNTEVAVVSAGKPFKDEYVRATGTITKADNFEAEVKLNRPYPFTNNSEAAWVYVTKQSFSQQKIGVDLTKIKDKKIKERLTEAIKTSSLLEFQSRGTLIVEQLKNKLLIKSKTLDRTLYSVLDINPDSVITALGEYAKTSFLMKAEVSDEDYLVTLEILPVKDEEGPIYGESYKRGKKNGNIEIDLNQKIVFEVTNQRDRVTYFNILFLKENGETRVIVPCLRNGSCEVNSSSFELHPYESMKIICRALIFEKTEDAGMFKVIATSQPVNLCKTLQKQASASSRSSWNTFENTFYKIGNNESTGISTRAVGDIEATTFDLVITLINNLTID